MVTIDNYEYFFYQYAEGLLTEAERADVEAFARQHPDLAEELSLYDPAVKAEAKVNQERAEAIAKKKAEIAAAAEAAAREAAEAAAAAAAEAEAPAENPEA